MMKSLTAFLISVTLSAPVAAQTLQAGEAAFQSADYATALENFRPLADQGDAGAQLWLGIMYTTGYGVPEDDAEAIRWIHSAANQGYVDAQVALGGIYFLGRDVSPNYVLSQMWMNIASTNGFQSSTDTENSLKSFLTEAQLEEAQERATVCLESGYADCE